MGDYFPVTTINTDFQYRKNPVLNFYSVVMSKDL